MASNLADPYLKTARAKEHLEDLRERLQRYRDHEPIRFLREDDHTNGTHVVRIKIKPIPDKIPLIAGDFLYCLRSSLDQLVWALAKNVGSYPEGTQFPILENRDAKKLARNTSAVPADAVIIVESLQPYNAQNPSLVRSHLLWQLNKLCNIDKHRRIPTDATIMDFNFPDFPRQYKDRIKFDADREIVTVPLELKSYVTPAPVANLNVTFGDSYENIRCDLERFDQMYDFVSEKVIPKFKRFFP